MKRQEQREWLVRLAFQTEGQRPADRSIADLLSAHELPTQNVYLNNSLESLFAHRAEIDAILSEHLGHKWTFSRLSRIDVAILRVAVNEMLFTRTAPIGVAINEAVELAQQYSDANAYRFINGVLSSVVHAFEDAKREKA